MSSTGERIRAARERRGWTQAILAEKLNIKIGTLSGYERNYRQPNPQMLQKIASLLGVTGDYLLGLTDDPLGTAVQKVTGSDATWLPSNAWPAKNFRPVPILGVIRAGEPIYAEQHIEGYEMLPEENVRSGEYFFLRVVGDSMKDARIEDGDLVFVRRQDWVEDGDIAVVMVNGEDATVKQVFFNGDEITLSPANPMYKPITFRGREKEDVRIIGKVLWFKGMPRKYAR